MSASGPSPATPSRASSPRLDEVSLWRGRYIEEFALAETAVSKALARLAEVSRGSSRGFLPHSLGQRFATLEALVGSQGTLSTEGSRVAALLEEWESLRKLRTFLCHGSSEIVVDDNGDWVVKLHLLTFQKGTSERSTMSVTESEAAYTLDQIASARVRLEGQLAGMLAGFNR